MIWRAPISLLIVLLFTAGCAGSTSFLGEGFPEMTLAPGVSDSLLLQLEAEGSHSGEYEITATVESGEGLSATVEPESVEVDGVVDITVTVTAADDAPAGNGVVKVLADDGSHSSSRSISITVE